MASRVAPKSGRAAGTLAAFVLHRYDWSESSLILDLFTREQGRVAVAAKGAKRPHSQLRPVLLPFQRIHVALGRAPKAADGDDTSSDIQNLRSAEWGGGAAMLTGAALFSGFYLNELLMRLTARHDPHPVLFDVYAATLADLRGEDSQVQPALRAFELRLLSEIGLLPDLSLETATLAAVQPDESYSLLPEQGVSRARASSELALPGRTLVGVQAALQHGSLDALRHACHASLPELRACLRSLLHYHLGSPVMRTRQVMLDVQALDR